jgi:hypothetical protein
VRHPRRVRRRFVSVPRRTKSIITHPELVQRIGSPGVELRVPERIALDVPTAPRHKGWKWPCSCSAFVRPEGDGYLWVPCPAHTESLREA